MKLRRRIENSDFLAAVLSWLLAGYLRLCFATIRWTVQGQDALARDLADGPVILVLWHSRLLIGPSAWPSDLAKLFTLRDPSPAGRLSSETQARLGMAPIKMRPESSNFAASRQVLRVIRNGHSLGMTADGPLGPDRRAKQAPLEWARATGRPVYLFAWSARRTIRLKTWDRLMIPVPFSRGVYIHQRWPVAISPKLTAQQYSDLRKDLSRHLDAVTSQADQMAGGDRGS